MSEQPYMRGLSKARYLVAKGKGLGLPLTARETQVVLAVMAGHTTAKSLADAIKRAEATCNNYLYQIYAKSGAVNMAQLVLMMTGVLPCPAALLPVQRIWRRKHYKLEEN